MSQQVIRRRIPRAVPAVGVLIAVAQSVWVLASLLFAGLTCDESCDPTSGLWRDDPSAWQWNALCIVSFAGLLCAVAAIGFAWRDRVREMWLAYGLSAAAIVLWAVIWTS